MSREIEYWCFNCDAPLNTSVAFNHEYDENYYCPDCFDICVVEDDNSDL